MSAVSLNTFDSRTVEFLDDLSRAILKSTDLNRIAEMAALGFWLRKANISQFIKENLTCIETENCKVAPVGLVFHICPSNVDTMFMYSLAISLLMGNRNVLRVSKRQSSPHLNTLYDLLSEVCDSEENILFSSYFSIITYEHDKEINEYFSSNANARMIWGGDSTIETFKSFSTSPRTKDILFADRISYALFKSSAYGGLGENEKRDLLKRFYNDAYSFNQKGCSSPQAIFVLGNEKDNRIFRQDFYKRLKEIVTNKYDWDLYSLASLKLNQLAGDAISGKIEHVLEEDVRVTFAELKDETNASGTCGGGFFYLHQLESMNEMLHYINPKVQTVSYFGLDGSDLELLSALTSGKGIDRLVPMGKSLDFHYIWDGYNLFDELCSKRYIV